MATWMTMVLQMTRRTPGNPDQKECQLESHFRAIPTLRTRFKDPETGNGELDPEVFDRGSEST